MNRKIVVSLMALAIIFAMTSVALAVQDPPGGSGNIMPNKYEKEVGVTGNNPDLQHFGTGTYKEYVQGMEDNTYSDAFDTSMHLYGTWNSPYTAGIDGFNYNDPQDYVADGDQNSSNGYRFQSGPHGGYLTSTHRCRECHAVHRAAGKFKLLRSDTRFEACDWCHGTGAGSGFNIQMDNDDNYSTEYNVGHTMGFGISSGKWKAPDDTYPAFTPNYWQGGFSCFDCHSPHANPKRMLGYNDQGQVKGLAWADPSYYNGETRYYSIINPGHGSVTDAPGASIKCVDCHKKVISGGNFVSGTPSAVPLYQSGSWLLIKNADREIAETSEVVSYYKVSDELDTPGTIEDIQIVAGEEISDMIYAYSEVIDGEPTVTAGQLHQFDAGVAYPVNKIPIDWNNPIGIAKAPDGNSGFDQRSSIPGEPSHSLIWNINEFCTDCHDGNSGLHTVVAPLFSEDRALRAETNESTADTNWRGSYDIAYGHDENSRHCGRQMQFNPENITVFGPHCRNCHKGSSSCGRCHSESSAGSMFGIGLPEPIYTDNIDYAAMNDYDRAPQIMKWDSVKKTWVLVDPYPGIQGQSTYHVKQTSTGESNMAIDSEFTMPHTDDPENANHSFMFKKSRTVDWYSGWREATGFVQVGQRMDQTTGAGVDCSDDGFSWPHRTLGWKMLKDDLFGLDFTGPEGTHSGNTVDRNNDGIAETVEDGYAEVGEYRTYGGQNYKVHDLDSVCLDCHNPTVWRATSASDHVDDPTTTVDDHNDELLTRGLP